MGFGHQKLDTGVLKEEPAPPRDCAEEGRCCKREKRRKILEAAATAFANRDYHQVKTDDIAAAAGVGKGTLFRYFASKEELFMATALFAAEVASAEIERALAGLDDPIERLETACEQIIAFYQESRCFLRMLHHNKLMHDHEQHREFHRRQDLLRGKFAELIAEGRRRGHFRKVDANVAGRLLFGMLRTLTRMPEFQGRPPAEISRIALEHFVIGVGTDRVECRPQND